MSTSVQLIAPRPRDLGSFSVRRVLPAAGLRMVGPFIFFDHMGPVRFAPGEGMDVRPHPHIGLATVTYLFEGEILHRDSLGFVQPIRPGDVNWMTAGRGIVHSERTAPELRRSGFALHGIQSWVALPRTHEDTAPDFQHHPSATLPEWSAGGVQVKLIAGTYDGRKSPAPVLWPTLYADLRFEPGASFTLSPEHAERALYVAEGAVMAEAQLTEAGQMAAFSPGADVILQAGPEGARAMLLGGAPMDGPRHIWWNFVASSQERIDAAKDAWRAQGFGQVPGETEFIPLPEM